MNLYEEYCKRCLARGETPPTQEWWDKACAQPQGWRRVNPDQREIDRERQEGWAYGY